MRLEERRKKFWIITPGDHVAYTECRGHRFSPRDDWWFSETYGTRQGHEVFWTEEKALDAVIAKLEGEIAEREAKLEQHRFRLGKLEEQKRDDS